VFRNVAREQPDPMLGDLISAQHLHDLLIERRKFAMANACAVSIGADEEDIFRLAERIYRWVYEEAE
jgi:hypothetical protein